MWKSRTITDAEDQSWQPRNSSSPTPERFFGKNLWSWVGISADALAKALDVPLPRVNDIVREKRAISPEMAVLLSAYFGTSDGYWINLQAHYDLEMAKNRVAKQVARIRRHPHDENGELLPV
jgi:addiction module HigA family antidote